jgi:hypothetical protein
MKCLARSDRGDASGFASSGSRARGVGASFTRRAAGPRGGARSAPRAPVSCIGSARDWLFRTRACLGACHGSCARGWVPGRAPGEGVPCLRALVPCPLIVANCYVRGQPGCATRPRRPSSYSGTTFVGSSSVCSFGARCRCSAGTSWTFTLRPCPRRASNDRGLAGVALRDEAGTAVELVVHRVEGRAHLPIVELRRAA